MIQALHLPNQTIFLRLVVCFILFCCIPSLLHAQGLPITRPEDVGLSSQRLERIRPRMQSYVDSGKLPGVMTLVARHGHIAHFETIGSMDREAGKPMRPDAIFRMYSMTKPVTGVAMMILYEEGRYLLTDSVSMYLPEFAGLGVFLGGSGDNVRTEPAKLMTIKHLLTHTAGLAYADREPGVDQMYREAELFRAPNLEEFVRRLSLLPLLTHPGARWHYSVAMDVLGRLVEVLSGQPFDDFLARRIFEPLGMVDTGFFIDDERLDRLAASYRATDEAGVRLVDAPRESSFPDPDRVPFGGQGLLSTASDYIRFAQMLANSGQLDGTRILSRKTADLMMMDQLGSEYGSKPLASMTSSLQSSPEGVGFGFTGAVVRDVAATSLVGSVGSFSWGGAASTYFWVDRSEELVGLLLTQVGPSDRYPLRAEIRVLAYQAIDD